MAASRIGRFGKRGGNARTCPRRREILLVRAARRIADGAPAKKVCRELGTSEAELFTWRMVASPAATRIPELEEETGRLRSAVETLRTHRRMLLDMFDLVLPPPTPSAEPSHPDEEPPERTRPKARATRRGFVM
jgi:putative transposase